LYISIDTEDNYLFDFILKKINFSSKKEAKKTIREIFSEKDITLE
jgi:hypothetical protein